MSHRQTVVFVHIPKAAGSTLHAILEHQYRRTRIYNVHASGLAQLLELTEGQRREIGLVKGHMPFGIHEHLPNETVYITILRHPVERAVSHYHYVMRQPNHYVHERVSHRNITLEDYVCAGVTYEMDNGQVRLLSGHEDDLPFGECRREHLDQAKRNLLEHFSVVGLTEQFDASVVLMQHVLGWTDPPYYTKRNVRAASPPHVASSVRRRIEHLNAMDMELYEYGRSLFGESLSRVPSFERRYDQFRRRMKYIGPCLAIAHRIRGRVSGCA